MFIENVVIYSVLSIVSMYMYCYFFKNSFYIKRKYNPYLVFIVCANFLVVFDYIFIIFQNPLISGLLRLVVILILSKMYFKNLIDSIFGALGIFFMQCFVEISVIYIYSLITNRISELNEYANYFDVFFLVAISKIILLTIIQVISWTQKSMLNNEFAVRWKRFFVIRTISLPAAFILILLISYNIEEVPDFINFVPIFCVLFLNIVFIFLFDELFDTMNLDTENKLLNKQIQYYSLQWEGIEKKWQEAKSINHDLKHRLLNIKSKIESEKAGNENSNSAVDEINRIIGNVDKETTLVFSGIPIIDAILNYEYSIAKSYNIDLDIKIFISGKIKIEDSALAIILGNSIDNAIEACLQSTKFPKSISIIIRDFQKNLYISIANHYEGQIKIQEGLPNTTKDKANHGMGLKSIEKIVSMNNGSMKIDYENFEFRLEIIMFEAVL